MQVSIQFLEGAELCEQVLLGLVPRARRSLWIATANVKDCRVEIGGSYRPIADLFLALCRRGVDVRILHAGVPSEAFRESLSRCGLADHPNFGMRRCPRVHFKAVLVDDDFLHLGSANLTGAGLGAKGPTRRNFELGFLTRDGLLRDRVAQLFHDIWEGLHCADCGQRRLCPAPLESKA